MKHIFTVKWVTKCVIKEKCMDLLALALLWHMRIDDDEPMHTRCDSIQRHMW